MHQKQSGHLIPISSKWRWDCWHGSAPSQAKCSFNLVIVTELMLQKRWTARPVTRPGYPMTGIEHNQLTVHACTQIQPVSASKAVFITFPCSPPQICWPRLQLIFLHNKFVRTPLLCSNTFEVLDRRIAKFSSCKSKVKGTTSPPIYQTYLLFTFQIFSKESCC